MGSWKLPAGHEQEGLWSRKKKNCFLSQMHCTPKSQHSFNGKATFCLIRMQRISWKHEPDGEWCTLIGFISKAWKPQSLCILITYSFPCSIHLATKRWHLKVYITGSNSAIVRSKKTADYNTKGVYLQGVTSLLSHRRWQKIWPLEKRPLIFFSI